MPPRIQNTYTKHLQKTRTQKKKGRKRYARMAYCKRIFENAKVLRNIIVKFAVCATGGLLVYVLSLILVKCEELMILISQIRDKFGN